VLSKIENGDLHVSDYKMKARIERLISIEWGGLYEILKRKEKKTVVFIDPLVYSLNSSSFDRIEKCNQNVEIIPTMINESQKNLDSLVGVLERFENLSIGRRDDFVYAVGGGALLDLISLAANLFRRGVSVVKVPTTLLGCVDASIGIKTGINFLNRRNRLGTYYLNYSVLLDTSFLTSLGTSLLREGLGEIFKIALIKSEPLFRLLEENKKKLLSSDFYTSDKGRQIISMSIGLMLEELHENPTESDLKRNVDFGHSFSPLVEMYSIELNGVEEISHGIAVGNDCVLTSIIAKNRKLLSESDLLRVISLAEFIDFNKYHQLQRDVDVMWSSFMDMTKHRGGDQNLPVPIGIGSYDFLQDVTYEELVKAVAENANE